MNDLSVSLSSPLMAEAVRRAYRAGEEDELMEPIILSNKNGAPLGRICHGDYTIFYDVRGEREIELTESFTDPTFNKFPTSVKAQFATMIEYDSRLNAKVAFPPVATISDTLCEVISQNRLSQAKIVESEKATHLCYFLNGKWKDPFPGEERVIIPTTKEVRTFDEKPEMSIGAVTKAIIQKLEDKGTDIIFANFANVDVVGHIINEESILKAVEAVDGSIGRVVEAAKRAGVTVIITADHGTVEKWLFPDGAIDTGHTDSPVPFILINSGTDEGLTLRLRDGGELSDVAPTVLELLNIPKPRLMTGKNLLIGNPLKERRGKRRILLLIADGWGVNDERRGNLIAKAHTPIMDTLKERYPHTTLKAAGEAVGMPEGTVGNSEVGHLHLSSGRRIYSDRLRINQAIKDGSFFKNEAFLWAMQGAKRDSKRLHLLGIISFYSSHGSIDHLLALLRLAKAQGVPEVYIHGMLGRRGERPESGAEYVELIERETAELQIGRVVTIIGRYWSLDREENWDRIEKTYRAFVHGEGRKVMLLR